MFGNTPRIIEKYRKSETESSEFEPTVSQTLIDQGLPDQEKLKSTQAIVS